MSAQAAVDRKVSYKQMKDGTKEDYALMSSNLKAFRAEATDRVLEYLKGLQGVPGEHVTTYEHSLQSATRALRDGADEETVVAALLHDIGVPLALDDHDEMAATIIRPYVSWDTYWMIKHHGLFQGYYYFHHLGRDRNERDKYRGHPAYAKTVEFCEKWDQSSFDPDYDTLPLSVFEPMVRRIFGREPWGARTREP
jgi:predicted HD phosphohydrolase